MNDLHKFSPATKLNVFFSVKQRIASAEQVLNPGRLLSLFLCSFSQRSLEYFQFISVDGWLSCRPGCSSVCGGESEDEDMCV